MGHSPRTPVCQADLEIAGRPPIRRVESGVIVVSGAVGSPLVFATLDASCEGKASRGGTIPEITMRYASRYSSHDTIRITILR